MIQQNWRQFIEYPAELREYYFSKRHGRMVLEVIGELQLDNLQILNTNNKNLISTNEFFQFLANDFSVRYSLDQFSSHILLNFLSFLYLKSMNPFSNVLIDVVSLSAISGFFTDERQASMQMPKLSQSKLVINQFQQMKKQNLEEQKQDIQPIRQMSFFDNLGTPQTPQNIQLDDASEQYQIDNQMKIRNLKKQRFQKLQEESEVINDPISAITHIKDKNPLINFESSIHETTGNLFICHYRSNALGIPEVSSDPKARKKQAQTNAAAKFYPHLRYYIEYKIPYFENDDEEFNYLQNKSATTAGGGPSINNETQEEEERKQQQSAEADFDLHAEFDFLELKSESITQVYYQIQRNESSNGTDNIKTNYSQIQQGIICCTVSFCQKGFEVYTCLGYGRSKKQAKEVAFYKLLPLVSKYYNPEQQLLPQPPRKLDPHFQNLRNNIVECEPPDQY